MKVRGKEGRRKVMGDHSGGHKKAFGRMCCQLYPVTDKGYLKEDQNWGVQQDKSENPKEEIKCIV